MKSLLLARPRTCGPIRIPSRSSITTTGGANRRGRTTTVTAAIAATTTITKNELASTLIKPRPYPDKRRSSTRARLESAADEDLGKTNRGGGHRAHDLALRRRRRRRGRGTVSGPVDGRRLDRRAGARSERPAGGRQRLLLRALQAPPPAGRPRPRPGREPDRQLGHDLSVPGQPRLLRLRAHLRDPRLGEAARLPAGWAGADAAQRARAEALRRPGDQPHRRPTNRHRRSLRGQPDAELVASSTSAAGASSSTTSGSRRSGTAPISPASARSTRSARRSGCRTASIRRSRRTAPHARSSSPTRGSSRG